MKKALLLVSTLTTRRCAALEYFHAQHKLLYMHSNVKRSSSVRELVKQKGKLTINKQTGKNTNELQFYLRSNQSPSNTRLQFTTS